MFRREAACETRRSGTPSSAVTARPNNVASVVSFSPTAQMIAMVLQTLFDFVIIAFVIFLFLKAYNRLREPAPEPATPEDVLLLREIRDSLKR